MIGALGPCTAHAVLVGSWVAPPVLLLGSSIASGWPMLGPLGATITGVVMTGALVGGPKNGVYRSGLCTALAALAMKADGGERAWALAAAGTASLLTFIVSVPTSKDPAGTFFRLITQTLRGREYYAEAELRGAVDTIKPGRNFFACHPHGCLSAGWTWNLFWNPDFHKRTGRIGFFIDPFLRSRNPVFRQVCDWYEGDRQQRYAAAADKSSMKAAMKRGEAIALIPGGFEDATIMATGVERTAISKRQGFVKYCLEEGYPITPVYTFGEADTYWTFSGLTSFRLWFNKYKIPMALFYGRWWCPIFPRPDVKLFTYVGEPLVLPQIERPSAEEVAYWHSKYIQSLQDMFDKYKAEVPPHLNLFNPTPPPQTRKDHMRSIPPRRSAAPQPGTPNPKSRSPNVQASFSLSEPRTPKPEPGMCKPEWKLKAIRQWQVGKPNAVLEIW